jgi:signal transduction histidine kinase
VVVSYRGGKLARLQVPTHNGPYTVRAYMTNDQMNSGETPWWILLGAASAGLLLLGVVGGEVFTRRIVRPLDQTASTAQRLAAGDVTARAPVDGPAEIAAVGQALNRLADRIDELIAEERETVADLSHRLRTPLTALRLDAESLRDPVEAERIGAHASVLERMLTAVIRAARRPGRGGRMPACDASEVVRERVAFWSALTEEQNRTADVSLPAGSLPVRAAAEDLGAAVDALLENVVAHTPEGTAFAVHLRPDDAGAVLDVSDSGAGIPPDAVLRGRSDRGSSGLGLDIARRCAEGTGGRMEIGRSRTGGALVTLRLHAP